MVVPLGGVVTTVVPFGVGERALDRPERTDCGHQLDQLEEEAPRRTSGHDRASPASASVRRFLREAVRGLFLRGLSGGYRKPVYHNHSPLCYRGAMLPRGSTLAALQPARALAGLGDPTVIRIKVIKLD